MVLSQFVSHAAVRALAGALIAELNDLGAEVTGYSDGICAVTPLSSTPMGGRNVAMLTAQQQHFLQNMILQIQQQIGHCAGINSKSVANELTDAAGGNSMTMSGVSSIGGQISGVGGGGMPAMSGAASGASSIGGAGSSALNQVGQIGSQIGSSAGSSANQQNSGNQSHTPSNTNSTAHDSKNGHGAHGLHKAVSQKPMFSIKSNPEFTTNTHSSPNHGAPVGIPVTQTK